MTICPIALAVGCKKCPVFKICPVKSTLGDAPKAVEIKTVAKPGTRPPAKPVAKPAAGRKKAKK